MQRLKSHHRTATRSQIIEFLNSHPELQFKLAEMTNLERAEFVWEKLHPESQPLGAGDVIVPPDAIPPSVPVPVDVLDTVISLITDARLDMRDAPRLRRDRDPLARAQDSLGNAVASLGLYLPRTAAGKECGRAAALGLLEELIGRHEARRAEATIEERALLDGLYDVRACLCATVAPKGTEAPPCRKCGMHRDANVHLAQYQYATYHPYQE